MTTRLIHCLTGIALAASTSCCVPAPRPVVNPTAAALLSESKLSRADSERCDELANQSETAPLSAADQELLKLVPRAAVVSSRKYGIRMDCLLATGRHPWVSKFYGPEYEAKIRQRVEQESIDRGGKPFGPPTPGPQICRSTYLPVTGDTITVCD